MKTLIKISLTALLLLSVLSCSKPKAEEEVGYHPKFKNCIRYYVNPTNLWTGFFDLDKGTDIGISTQEYKYDGITISNGFYPLKMMDQIFINENFISKTHKSIAGVVEYEVPYSAEKNRIYDSLCVAHNDLAYNRSEQFLFPVLFRKVESITIYSDTDYDTGHPAGSSLENITNIHFYSVEKFLANNYKQYPAIKYFQFSEDITEPLSTFNQENRKLISACFGLCFTVAPEKTSTHRFTITYTDEDGKVLATTTEPITIKGAN